MDLERLKARAAEVAERETADLLTHTTASKALYERAVKVWPGNYASLANWGALLWERSARAMARASALEAEGRHDEAEALVRQARTGFREGMEKVDQALAIMPSYAHAHLVRALLLIDYRQDPAGAIAEYEQVLGLMPGHPQRPAIEQDLARLRAQLASTGQPDGPR